VARGTTGAVLLRTTGRKTGAERTAALVYLEDGDDLVIVASNGGSDRPPAWLLNIQKMPTVGVQIGRERRQMKGPRSEARGARRACGRWSTS